MTLTAWLEPTSVPPVPGVPPRNHWNCSGVELLNALTFRRKLPMPGFGAAVGVWISRSAHGVTLIVAVGLSTGVPHAPLTRTQYCVVITGETGRFGELCPIG
jgi:hypothetical protein